MSEELKWASIPHFEDFYNSEAFNEIWELSPKRVSKELFARWLFEEKIYTKERIEKLYGIKPRYKTKNEYKKNDEELKKS